VRESDEVEDFRAPSFMGGEVTEKEMPPQCVRVTSGDSQCAVNPLPQYFQLCSLYYFVFP